MATLDDILATGSVASTPMGNPIGLVHQQLKIMTLILKQSFGISDEDFTFLQAPTPNFASGVTALTTSNQPTT